MMNVSDGACSTIRVSRKSDQLISALKKFKKYSYEGVTYGASFDDMDVWEHNKICKMVYEINEASVVLKRTCIY